MSPVKPRYDLAMRGVHRKVEEPSRWTPTLTPTQQKLWVRLDYFGLACVVTGVLLSGALEFLNLPPWVSYTVGSLFLIALALLTLMIRTLQKTGPPFDQVRWWWPWKSPRS
jgi:hypothetical protein